MEFSISIQPDEDLKKQIDSLRYHYDRKLLRENAPYIKVYGPVESFINLKKISASVADYFKQKKRFRIHTDMIGFLDSEKTIFLNITTPLKIREIYEDLKKLINLPEPPFFFPHIEIAKNHSLEELETIYEELKENEIHYNSFCENIAIHFKEGHFWEEYASFVL